MSSISPKLSSHLCTYRVGIILLAVIFVMLIYWKRNVICGDQNGDLFITLNDHLDGNKKSTIVQQQFEPDRYQQQKSVGFDYKKEVQNLFRPDTHQDDSCRLINILRNYFIEQPSTEPYNLEHPDQLRVFSRTIDILQERGFYVECGALNGETSPTSLFFERVRKWNGLLIEADPSNYELLKWKAFAVNACFSTSSLPSKLGTHLAWNSHFLKETENNVLAWIIKNKASYD